MAIRVRHCGLGVESTYATSVAPTLFFECFNENVKFDPVDEEQALIRSPHIAKIKRLGGVVRGDIEIALGYQEAAHLLYGILGSVTTSGAGPYTHTSPGTQGITKRPSWTLEIGRDNTPRTFRYDGMIIVGLALAIAPDQQVRATVSFVGSDETKGVVATPSYTTDDMLPSHCTVTIDAASQETMAVNINIARPVDERLQLGQSVFTTQPPDSGPFNVAGDFTIRDEANLTNYAKFYAANDVDLTFLADSGNPETLTLNMNKARLKQATPNVDGQAMSEATYEFVSYLDTVATGSIQSVTINDEVTVP